MGQQWLNDVQLDDVHHLIATSTREQAPAFSLRQACTWGVSRAEVLALQRTSRVHKIRHGAYCLTDIWTAAQTDAPLKRRILASAAMAGMRHPCFACGPFAAELHGLPLPAWEPATIDLVRDLGTDVRSARNGVKRVNQLEGVCIVSRNMGGERSVDVHGISSVDLGTAALTAAARLNLEHAIALMDATLRNGLTHDQLSATAQRWASTKGMREAGRRISLARSGAESPLESISRVRLLKRGLPEPVLQHEFHDHYGFVGRADMWWPSWKVIGEADGLAKYDDLSVLRKEKIREDRLRALGLTVVRWTWDEMWNSPGNVAGRILAARASEAARRSVG